MDWRDRAICNGMSYDEINQIFFIGKGQKSNNAKVLCARCPVQDACLEFALIYKQQGIWGGTTDLERKKMEPVARILKTQAILEGTYHPLPEWEDLFPRTRQTVYEEPPEPEVRLPEELQ
jgi:WhiB family redox-sensing transcriptional regulator